MRHLRALLAALVVAAPLVGVGAQDVYGPSPGPPPSPAGAETGVGADDSGQLRDYLLEQLGGAPVGTPPNPVGLLEGAAESTPGFDGGLSGALNVMVLLTILALVPSIMIMTTSFVRIIIVLGLLKQAMGTQSLPPGQVISALALFMTFMVMGPTLERVYDEAIGPYQRGEIVDQVEMWEKAKAPMRDFMFAQIESTGNWSSIYMMLNYRGVDTTDPASLSRADVDTMSLVAAYMLSELKTAFVMGFRVYLPFLIIDMVIASLLISMSMMMLPPVLVSMPFKILLFVLVDGWTLVVGSLMTSFAQPGGPAAAALGG